MLDHDSMGGRGGRAMIAFLAYSCEQLCWQHRMGRGISHSDLFGHLQYLTGNQGLLPEAVFPYVEDGAEYIRRVRQ